MRRLIAGLSLALSSALSGCSADDIARALVPEPLSLSFSGTTAAVGKSLLIDRVQGYQCAFTFTVKASGGAEGEGALWSYSEIGFRLTSNGQTSTSTLSSSDLQDWFGVDRVAYGASLTSNRLFSWSGPFTGTVTFRYLVLTNANPFGVSHSTNVPVTCT